MANIVSSSRYKINKKLVKKTVEDILVKHGLPASTTVNVIFIGRKKMKSIAAKYKDENLALPVLSFSYLDKKKTSDSDLIGEIFICYPQAVLLAAEREKKVDYILEFLITHGINNILQ